MAAIGRRTLLALAACAVLRGADDSANALAAVNRLSTGLSGGDAEGAIDAFEKSCPDYDRLSEYFAALTSAFAITIEADLTDDQESDTHVHLVFDWTLTLRSLASGQTLRRAQQVKVQVARQTWKITRFSPVDLFGPA